MFKKLFCRAFHLLPFNIKAYIVQKMGANNSGEVYNEEDESVVGHVYGWMGFMLIVPIDGKQKYFEDITNRIEPLYLDEDHFSGKLPFDEEDK